VPRAHRPAEDARSRPVLRVVAIALVVALVVLVPVSAASGFARAWEGLLYSVAGCGFLLVGLTIIERRPENRIGPLAFGLGATIGLIILANLYASQPGPPPGHAVAAWFASVLDAPLYAWAVLLFLVFPTGRLPSRRWRVVAVLAVMPALTEAVTRALTPGPFPYFPWIMNPFGIDGLPWVGTEGPFIWGELFLALVVFAIPTVIACLAPVARWRRGDRTERAQLKWVGAAAILNVVALTVYLVEFETHAVTGIGDVAVGAASAAFPIAIGIAVLRYRLYEIDRLISRTIGWAIVTGLLGAAFVVLVLGLTSVLGRVTGGDTLAVASSTLVVAALFSPVRSWVQAAVDRRFDRSRYDGERLVAAFGERLRDEVDLATITTDVLTTVDAAVRPSPVGLWLRERQGGGA
jgi:hypothetical protein